MRNGYNSLQSAHSTSAFSDGLQKVSGTILNIMPALAYVPSSIGRLPVRECHFDESYLRFLNENTNDDRAHYQYAVPHGIKEYERGAVTTSGWDVKRKARSKNVPKDNDCQAKAYDRYHTME